MFERKYPKFVFSNLSQRFIAYIIDIILISAVSRFIINIFLALGLEGTRGVFSISSITRTLIYLGYFTLLTKFTNGYTLGKAIMGMKVVSFIEDELSWQTVLTRELFAGFVMYKIKILYLLPLFTDYKQNLGDILAETSVLKLSYLEEMEDYFDDYNDHDQGQNVDDETIYNYGVERNSY